MKMFHPLAVIAAAAAFLGLSLAAGAQTPPQTPKVIGRPQQPKIIPSMIVLNARSAKIEGNKLVLEGISPNAIIFADRPIRSAGHALTAHLLEEWSDKAPDSFAKTPPNATVSVFSKNKKGVTDAVVVLKSPKLDGERLTFDVDVLENSLVDADGAASVFVDIINLPAARRTAHRAAWYAGAN